MNLDSPDLEKFPLFRQARVEHCVLEPGVMLFIPAFYWHQVMGTGHQAVPRMTSDKGVVF